MWSCKLIPWYNSTHGIGLCHYLVVNFHTVPARFSLFCISVSSVYDSSVLALALFRVGVLLLPLVLKECLFSLGECPKNKPLIAFTPTPRDSLQHRGRAVLISSKHASFLPLLSAAIGAEIRTPEITIMQIAHNYRLFYPDVSSIASWPLARRMRVCSESTQKPEFLRLKWVKRQGLKQTWSFWEELKWSGTTWAECC